MNSPKSLLKRLKQQVAQFGTCFDCNVNAFLFRGIQQSIMHSDFAIQKFPHVKTLRKGNAPKPIQARVALGVETCHMWMW